MLFTPEVQTSLYKGDNFYTTSQEYIQVISLKIYITKIISMN